MDRRGRPGTPSRPLRVPGHHREIALQKSVMAKQVSAIVLNWNSREMTAECLRSLLAMDARDFEIVVVDNGSRDGSPHYLRKAFPQITVIENGRNLGFAAGCNVGMKRALEDGAEYVLLVNNDTLVDRGLLRELVAEAERNPEAAIVSPRIYYYDFPDRIWWVGGTYNGWIGIPRHLDLRKKISARHEKSRNLEWATGCAMLVRCSVLREIGLFDERFFGQCEDVDLSLRARAGGYSVRYAPEAKLWHKEGIDYRKNAGEQARKFTGARNLLWLMHKHAAPIQWVTFWPCFLVRYVGVLALKSVKSGDFQSAGALFRGIWAFRQMRRNPSVTAPADLVLGRQRGPGTARR